MVQNLEVTVFAGPTLGSAHLCWNPDESPRRSPGDPHVLTRLCWAQGRTDRNKPSNNTFKIIPFLDLFLS